jgi:hypothetical protein
VDDGHDEEPVADGFDPVGVDTPENGLLLLPPVAVVRSKVNWPVASCLWMWYLLSSDLMAEPDLTAQIHGEDEEETSRDPPFHLLQFEPRMSGVSQMNQR